MGYHGFMHGPYTILIILLITMAFFIWGYWRYDVVAIIALTASVAVGAVPFSQAYSGLANPAVITVACVMIISDAIRRSGTMAYIVKKITSVTSSPTLHIASLSIISAALSAFMNNVGALALMMPVAIQTAIKSKRSPSLVLMPIALASALGGLTTLIGTPPNLLIASYRAELVNEPFSMFSFAHVGVPVAIVGIIFITLVGWRLMPGSRKVAKQPEDMFQIQDYIAEMKIPSNSKFIGVTIKELETKLHSDFRLIGIVRNKRKRFVLAPEHRLKEDDILIIESTPHVLEEILQQGGIELIGCERITSDALRTEDVALIEAVVPPGARIEGRSSHSSRLRSRYRVNLIAIARQGKPFKKRLNKVKLRAGDVVILQGPSDTLKENISSLGFLPLIERGLQVGIKKYKWLPIFIFMGGIALAAFQIVPVQIAFGGVVLVMVLTRSIPTRLIYDGIEWPVILLLAAMIPIGQALQTTGGTALISHFIIKLTAHLPHIYILALLLVTTMTLSDFMNNAATAVVMAPIAGSIAQAMHSNPDPFLMAVAIGASCSFLTPVGHQNNTLVMGPGGYKFSDYIRLGLPLEIIILIISLPLIIWFWPM